MIVTDEPPDSLIAITGKPGNKWQTQMELEWIPSVWSRYKPVFTYTHNFSCHFLLHFKTTDMFDYSIAVNLGNALKDKLYVWERDEHSPLIGP